MMHGDLDQYEKLRNDYRELIEHKLTIWDKLPTDKIPMNYYSIATESCSVAIYSLLLRDKAEALEWFRKSSAYFISHIDAERKRVGLCTSATESGRCFDAVCMAILSDDAGLVSHSVQLTLGICAEFPAKFRDPAQGFYVHRTLACFLNGDIDQARVMVDQINPLARKKYKLFYEGLKTCLTGLIDGDTAQLVRGLNILLADHYKDYATSKISYGLICIPATVFVKIALDRGIIITVKDIEVQYQRYVAWNLFD